MSSRGTVRRSVLFGAMFLLAMLAAACSSSAPVGDQSRAGGEPAALPAPTAAPVQAPAANGGNGDTSGPAPDAGLYIVRTGTLAVEVADVDAAVAKARDLIAAAGGYESGSDESTKGDQRFATITYRIPVDKWQDSITGLRAIGARVISESTQASEVSAQVVDLNARIANLRTAETSLQDIMTRAGTIDEVLNVQGHLQSVEEDIERLVAQQQDLTGRAALGTLAVTWQTAATAAVTEVQSGWNLGTEIDHALSQTVRAGQAFASFLIWVAFVGVPVLGPVLLLALLFWWLARRYRRSHPRPVYAGWQPVPAGYTQSPQGGWYPTVAAPPADGSGTEAVPPAGDAADGEDAAPGE